MNPLLALLRILTLVAGTGAALGGLADPVTIVTFRSSESVGDGRFDYDRELLQLALVKTREKYGPFQLKPSPVMNYSRAMLSLKNNAFPNFIIKLSFADSHPRELLHGDFPLDLGIVGYRVCFIAEKNRDKVAAMTEPAQLQALTIGQGRGWTDVDVLRHNGFEVIETPMYESLFEMVATGRFDLLCRGANEVLAEWMEHRHIPGFELDRSLALYYPLPRFFYVHYKNAQILQRVEEGLELAYEDGSLMALWEHHYQKSIDFAELQKRRIFRFPNPLLKGLDANYERYLFEPFKTPSP